MKERANPFLRVCDKYLGIPLVLFFALFKFKKKMPKKRGRIAFLKTAGIGDTVLLSAVVEEVKEAYPHAKVTFFSGKSNYETARLIAHIDVVKLPITSPLKALLTIRKHAFDLWIDCDPWPRINALFSFFSKSQFTIGFKTSGQGRHFLYDCEISHSFACHELDNYRKLVAPLGILGSKSPNFCTNKPKKKDNCKVALHLFAGGSRAYLKEWPKENWKKLISFLLENKIQVFLTGSRSDHSKLQEFELNGTVINLAGKTSLWQTARLLESSSCVVSIDTGIMHLAASLNVPVIALHGPTSPQRWGAVGKKVVSLTPDLVYTPCIQLGFESRCQISCCMKGISFEKVKNALIRVLLQKDISNENLDTLRRKRDAPLAAIEKEKS